jgi:hypothetical protein
MYKQELRVASKTGVFTVTMAITSLICCYYLSMSSLSKNVVLSNVQHTSITLKYFEKRNQPEAFASSGIVLARDI